VEGQGRAGGGEGEEALSAIRDVRVHVFHVSAKTNWCFVEVETADGLHGWGEASLNGMEPALIAATDALAARCRGLTLDQARARIVIDRAAEGELARHAATSALQQAVLDALARRAGLPVHRLLGVPQREAVPAYANINRATAERTPAGFVATALRAQQQGFNAFKAAPFDGLVPHEAACADGQRRIRHGIDCLFALRDALGPDARLMVDCHWRFDEASALDALRALRPARLHWFECPLSEAPAHWPALRRVRAAARDEGVLIAAAETQVGVDGFQRLFDAQLYDVVMPDVKYCGGPDEMLAIARRAADAGVMFSPHNPTGPVCTQHSLHVAAVAPDCALLELQFDESALYGELVGRQQAVVRDGVLALPQGAGLGVAPCAAALAAHPYRPVPPGIEAMANG
jgi:galactonate dehydratase